MLTREQSVVRGLNGARGIIIALMIAAPLWAILIFGIWAAAG